MRPAGPAIRTSTPTLLLPNKQPRADGTLVGVDSDSLWHEAKAAGTIYQATMRRARHRLPGHEWIKTDPHTGMAELAAVRRAPSNGGRSAPSSCVQGPRTTRSWPTARPAPRSWPPRRKPTRPRKPEGTVWAQLRWRDDPVDFRAIRPPKRSRNDSAYANWTGLVWNPLPTCAHRRRAG
jgi:hypothetical protein